VDYTIYCSGCNNGGDLKAKGKGYWERGSCVN